MVTSRGRALVLSLGLLLAAWSVASCSRADNPLELAQHRLEERLVAPCCWRGTLGDHTSELAFELRAEVRRRLEANESVGAIEADFVRRYGERVRALPADSDPRWIAIAVLSALVGAGLFVLWRVLHPRRARTGPPATSGAALDDEYQTRLDDELATVE